MSCRGVHFALGPEDLRRVLGAAGNDSALLELIQDDIEERYFGSENQWLFETDKAWDAIHRSLTDGELKINSGPFPLAYAVLGGRPLYEGDDYVVCLVEPQEVSATAEALRSVTEEWFRERYFAISPGDYGGAVSSEDFDYTWGNFQGLPELFARAANAGRAVMFTVDQ